MNVPEAAARLGVDPKTVYRMCQRGELPHHRYGRRVVIEEADLVAFKAAHRVEHPAGGVAAVAMPVRRRAAVDGRAAMEQIRRRAKELMRAGR